MGFVRFQELVVTVMHQGREIQVEKKCSTCAYGALDDDQDPCAQCFKNYTKEKPYTMWQFDPEYDETADVY